MNVKFVLITILFFLKQICFCQDNTDSIVVKNTPVYQGVIKVTKVGYPTTSDPSSFVAVFSISDSVYNMKTGVVSDIVNNQDYLTVVVKTAKRDFFVYTNLSASTVKKGDKLKIGTSVGLAKYSDNEKKHMVGISIIKREKFLNYDQLIHYFMRRR